MKSILILANSDVGLYKFRKELIIQLIKDGYRVYISSPYGDFIKRLELLGCSYIQTEVDRRGQRPCSDVKLLLTYFHLLHQIKPNFVITYTIKPNVYGGLACRFTNIKYAVNITGLGTAFYSGDLLKSFITMLYKISLSNCNTVFFENAFDQQYFIDKRIVTPNQTVLLNGAGVNLCDYPLSPYPQSNNIIFLFIGRIMKEKGIGELLLTAEKIQKKYCNINFYLVGDMEDDFKQRIELLHKKKIIKYIGFVKDVKPYIINAHCLILPSYHEGMANVLLEAGAIGRPIITTDIPGCRESVIDKKSGFLCNSQDAEDLYNKVNEFIQLSNSDKEQMGMYSHSYISSKFSRDNVIKKTLLYIK